ncbi:MAG: BACON domain-containing carbohydrate-binding protein, partial [Bacteroidota bacterium]
MMRFRIYSILLVVFGLLFGNGLQAQQLFNPQEVEALPLPKWHPPIGNSATPTKGITKQLKVPYRTLDQNVRFDENDPRALELYSIQKLLQAKQQNRGNINGSEKAFSDLEIIDIGEYGSPEGELDFNASVYFTVQVIIRTADGRLVGCTGVLVDANTVLTTGGCVYNTDLFGPEGFASEVFVFPGYDQRITEENNLLEYTFTQGVSVDATTGWVDDQDLGFNLGVITLARPIGGTVALFETGDGASPLMQLSSGSDIFFVTGNRLRNDAYPLGADFEERTQYTREGSFDEAESELLYHNDPSFAGMEGSPAYRPSTGDDVSAYAILSHLDGDDRTAYVRMTDDKIDFVEDAIDAGLPGMADLHPMVVPTNFIPDQVDPGATIGVEGDDLALAVYNHSSQDYTGGVFWAPFIVRDGAPVSEAIFLSENALGFSSRTISAGEYLFVGANDLFQIPEDTPPGQYQYGTIIIADDADPSNNNVIFPGDLIPIQIGDGNAITLAVDPSEISVDGQAGSTTFDITSTLDWSITESADWLTVSASRGSGNSTITVDYDQNPSTTDSRSATITVAAFDGSTDPVTVTITQEALSNFLFVMPDTLRVGGEAGTSSFTINTDLLWSVQESSDWFDASPTSGLGEGSVDLNYDRNSTDEARTSIINVTTNEGPSAEVVVIQEGAGVLETISVDPTAVNVDASAGETEVRVSSNTNWVAGGGDEWISFAPSAGDGDDIVTIKYDENTSLDSRQTTITFSTGSGESASVVITQAGAAAFIAVDPMTLNVDEGEGDASVAVNANESWTASSDSEWLVPFPDTGSGDTDIVISYLSNSSLDARTGTITFTSGSGETATLVVNQDGRPRVTVVDVVVNSDVHNTLEAAVIAADLAGTLSGDGPFTVFAPTDDAFAALPEGTLDALLADPSGDLTSILLYHVLSGKVLSTDLSDGLTATTLLGEDITVTINDDGVFINGAQVTMADIETDNGVVHVIDAVLLPPVDCEEAVEGGTVALEDGSTEATVFVGDGVSDFLSFMSMGAAEDASFTYVITDDQNNILGLPDGNMADFDNAGAGTCRVWGLSYTGEITAVPGDNAGDVDLSNECFELSSNFIVVNRISCADEVAGGTVALEDGSTEATVTVGD